MDVSSTLVPAQVVDKTTLEIYILVNSPKPKFTNSTPTWAVPTSPRGQEFHVQYLLPIYCMNDCHLDAIANAQHNPLPVVSLQALVTSNACQACRSHVRSRKACLGNAEFFRIPTVERQAMIHRLWQCYLEQHETSPDTNKNRTKCTLSPYSVASS